jgi:hypothetical protein
MGHWSHWYVFGAHLLRTGGTNAHTGGDKSWKAGGDANDTGAGGSWGGGDAGGGVDVVAAAVAGGTCRM